MEIKMQRHYVYLNSYDDGTYYYGYHYGESMKNECVKTLVSNTPPSVFDPPYYGSGVNVEGKASQLTKQEILSSHGTRSEALISEGLRVKAKGADPKMLNEAGR